MRQIKTKLLILGSGPAGCTAAIYSSRSDISPIMIHGNQPGGQLTITTEVENYPGYESPVQGPWLMEQMIKQAENVGCKIVNEHVIKIQIKKKPFSIITENDTEYLADSIIISTGASAKWLGLDSESKYRGFGVSACATCDAFFFKNKIVAVVGGGNTAVEEAIFLTKFAQKVYLIHRRNELRADKILQKKLFNNSKIFPLWDREVVDIKGNENPKLVKEIVVKSTKTNNTEKLEVDGLFVAIGHVPNTDLFKGQLNLDDEGYIITEKQVHTNIDGIFAAGDVHDKTYRQAVTAAGYGCMAALEVEKFLESEE